MKHKRVTSRDVAELAGVSRTTVSFVLNDVAGIKISQPTRERVLQAARDLGYIPDSAARTLVSGKTRSLGLVVNESHLISVDAFIAQLVYSLHEVCREHGYRLVVETAQSMEEQEGYQKLARAKRIDGLVILHPDRTDPQISDLIESSYPLVVIGPYAHPGVCSVSSGTEPPATFLTTSHLIGLGHRRIGFITFVPNLERVVQGRLRGYRVALDMAGLPFDESLVRFGAYSAESGFEAMRSLLMTKPRPTAVVAGNDTVALGAMAAIRQAGLRVPEDIAVTGHDDIPMARFAAPPLTTIQVPTYEMGRACGEMAIGLMNGETPAVRRVNFASQLIIRQSCGSTSSA